ncbi:RNA binding protein [Penicillium hispanicum]|uniref:RNA binding protein n=1 Tax=Penicillium hispanicum TaxID=1080232 RepID=UPI00253FC2B5|nr:RNA binding protein [Penicillium hispanicum]KAJ5573905.1 RNA binding protein [Penicillium hispanicum]
MDRSLDEIIAEDTRKQDRPSGGRRNQGRRRDRDGVRKPYSQDRVDLNLDWVHDKYEDDRDARPSRGSRRSQLSHSDDRGPALTKVRVENLHYDITESDLEDLFGRIGPVSNLSLVYDRAGRSEGVALITYTHLKDAHESIREFDGANAKGQPIRLTLVPGRRDRNTLFERVERPHGRNARSLSPASGSDGADGSRRRRGGRGRRSDVTKPAPDHIDRYVPGQRSPVRRSGGGRRGGGRDNRARNGEGGGRRTANGRPRKTQEELDQEMEDYWGGNAGTENAEKQGEQDQVAAAATATSGAPAATAPVADDDIDMIE